MKLFKSKNKFRNYKTKLKFIPNSNTTVTTTNGSLPKCSLNQWIVVLIQNKTVQYNQLTLLI